MHTITEISANATWPIRQQVMWPEKPLDYVKLKNDAEGQHFGLLKNNELVSVISLFIENNEAQFRKFATLESQQGNGYGSELLQHVINVAHQHQVKRLWCNARTNKTAFYVRFGLHTTPETFTKGGKQYVIMEKTF